MSSCLSGGGRTYGLDIVKPASSTSSSSAARSCHSSSPSSTLSESSNSPPRTISIKKARAPRKRPNQTYNEAAALLSTAYPTIFSVNSLKKLPRKPAPFDPSFPELPELLPPFPVLSNAAAFLIRDPPPPEYPTAAAAICVKLKPASPVTKSCESPASIESAEPPNSPAATAASFDDDFDAESILDEDVEESIDSIMGNLSMTAAANNARNIEEQNNQSLHINPYLRSLIELTTAGGAGKFDLSLRFRLGRKMQQALRHRDESDWWRIPAVPMQVPVPTPAKGNTPQFKPSLDKKKKKKTKKKVEQMETEDLQTTNATKPKAANTTTTKDSSKSGLGLTLNHEEVIKAWTGRGSMFSDGSDSLNSSADALARLADIDLSPEAGSAGGVREARVQRYKEKRLSRLFSKKIRYQVRKVNADQRPRMKASGRFVRRPSLLQQAIEEECQ